MKNKILFLVLIGLLTPTMQFSMQNQPQSLKDKFFAALSGFTSYLPAWMRLPTKEDLPSMQQWAQNLVSKLTSYQREALLAALLAATGVAVYSKPELTPYVGMAAVGGLAGSYLAGYYKTDEEIKAEIIEKITDSLNITENTTREDFKPIIEYLNEKEKKYQNNEKIKEFITNLIRDIQGMADTAMVINLLKKQINVFRRNQALVDKLSNKIRDIQVMLGRTGPAWESIIYFDKK